MGIMGDQSTEPGSPKPSWLREAKQTGRYYFITSQNKMRETAFGCFSPILLQFHAIRSQNAPADSWPRPPRFGLDLLDALHRS